MREDDGRRAGSLEFAEVRRIEGMALEVGIEAAEGEGKRAGRSEKDVFDGDCLVILG